MKICKKCVMEKLLSEYRECKSHNKIYYRTECRSCEKIYAESMKEKYRLQREENKDDIKRKRDEIHEKYPWKRNLTSAKQRCTNPKKRGYKHYGGKNIKFELSDKDGKYLWLRDKAYLMNIPTLDRKDSKGNYTLKNCQFLDKKIHDFKTQVENNCLPKKIIQLSENNEVVKIWDSLSQIIRLKGYFGLKLKKSIIQKELYKGFYWTYA